MLGAGSLLLRVVAPNGGPVPDELRAWVYDANGPLFRGVRVPDQGTLQVKSDTDLGTILIRLGESTGDVRAHLRGFVLGRRELDGVIIVPASSVDRARVDILLGTAIPSDGDSDEVPDAIDDCPLVYNPDQGGCPGGESVDAGTGVPNGPLDGAAGSDAGRPDTGTGGRGGSPGCGVASMGTGESTITLTMTESGASVGRQYIASRPNPYDPQRVHKVIIGLGSRVTTAAMIRQQLQIQNTAAAGAADEMFVYPIARSRAFGSWGTTVGWQLGPGAAETNAAGLDDLAFIDAMLADIASRFCVDVERMFVIGHGWGSDFAHALACLRGDRIKAIVGSATNGDYYLRRPAVTCVGQAATWTMHGQADPALPLASGMAALNYFVGQHRCGTTTQLLTVAGPNGNEACVSYDGCTAPTRWCGYDTSYAGAAPAYLGREALLFFRGF